MNTRMRRLLASFALLLILLAAEVGVSMLPLDRSVRCLVLIPAIIMAGVVAIAFMELGQGSQAARLFAIAALVWLAILLGLGSLDPMTRIDYPVERIQPTASKAA